MNCEKIISRDITINCTNPVIAGLEANAVIINRADLDRSAVLFNETRTNVIESLPLKTGSRGYKAAMVGAKPFTGTKTAMAKGTYRNTFDNDFGLVILDNDPDVVSGIIDGLANGTFVVVVENKYNNSAKATTPSDSAFQVIGFYQGLVAETIENDKYSEDTEGGWSVLLKETKSPVAALFLYKTSYAVTKQLFDALTVETPPPSGE